MRGGGGSFTWEHHFDDLNVIFRPVLAYNIQILHINLPHRRKKGRKTKGLNMLLIITKKKIGKSNNGKTYINLRVTQHNINL